MVFAGETTVQCHVHVLVPAARCLLVIQLGHVCLVVVSFTISPTGLCPFSKLDNWLNTKGFHADETRTSDQPAIAGRSLVNQRLNQRSDLIAG